MTAIIEKPVSEVIALRNQNEANGSVYDCNCLEEPTKFEGRLADDLGTHIYLFFRFDSL